MRPMLWKPCILSNILRPMFWKPYVLQGFLRPMLGKNTFYKKSQSPIEENIYFTRVKTRAQETMCFENLLRPMLRKNNMFYKVS